MFHDEVELNLISGKGGDGAVSFRREKFIPKGGPDGGDGGRGGDVIISASRQLSDLEHLASLRELKAPAGEPGAGRKMHGADAEDLTISVPVGTQVFRQKDNSWQLVYDFKQDGDAKRILRGGEGGLGNVHFATATKQTPRHAQPGQPGQRGHFKLELQLIADVGIIGLPNAGKSTFLSIVSAAKPKVADYPFTTLSPVLGVIEYQDERFIAADIPGLIEGASHGKGLGHTFLRHVRRTKVLVHFIDALSSDYARDYLTIRRELAEFDPGLTQKPEIVAITKAELITQDIQEDFEHKINDLKQSIKAPSTLFNMVTISAVTHNNIQQLLAEVSRKLSSAGPTL